MLAEVKTASNGIESADKMLHLKIDRNKAAEHGLTIAQIYQEILKHTTTEKNAITLNMDEKDVEVNLINETDKLTYENILDMKIETTEKNSSNQYTNVMIFGVTMVSKKRMSFIFYP